MSLHNQLIKIFIDWCWIFQNGIVVASVTEVASNSSWKLNFLILTIVYLTLYFIHDTNKSINKFFIRQRSNVMHMCSKPGSNSEYRKQRKAIKKEKNNNRWLNLAAWWWNHPKSFSVFHVGRSKVDVIFSNKLSSIEMEHCNILPKVNLSGIAIRWSPLDFDTGFVIPTCVCCGILFQIVHYNTYFIKM